jgi:Flp pilus assembly protein TadD
MFALLVLASVAAASPIEARLAETAHAISAGRTAQARAMLGEAIAAGAHNDQVEVLLADLAYATGRSHEALARYEQLSRRHPNESRFTERALISALKVGDLAKATLLAASATSSQHASWRAWNGRGVAADLRGDWTEADAAYARALEMSPGQAETLNNQGWSRLLRGQWEGAVASFKQALASNPAIPRLGNNLEFARAGLSAELPMRGKHESDNDWASRLNDAGVAAQSRGETARAVAAFSRAIEAKRSWYVRAVNNLRQIETRR